MDAKEVPARPNLEQYKKQAKDLVKIFNDLRARKASDPEVIQRLKKYHPRFVELPDFEIAIARFRLADAQLVIAREHGFESWTKFAKHIEALARDRSVALLENPRAAFIEAVDVARRNPRMCGPNRLGALMRRLFWATMPECVGSFRSIHGTLQRRVALTGGMR